VSVFFLWFAHRDETLSSPSIRAIKMAENFMMIFNDFRSHATNVPNFGNEFSVNVSDAPEILQLQLAELHMTQFCAVVSVRKLEPLILLL
jgi:hypothetical protein